MELQINKNNISQAVAALKQCAEEHKKDITNTGAIRVSDLCTDVASFLENLVILPIDGSVSSQKGSKGIVSTEVFELPEGLMSGDKVRLLLIV